MARPVEPRQLSGTASIMVQNKETWERLRAYAINHNLSLAYAVELAFTYFLDNMEAGKGNVRQENV